MTALIPQVKCNLCEKVFPINECGQIQITRRECWALVPAIGPDGKEFEIDGKKALTPFSRYENADYCPECYQKVCEALLKIRDNVEKEVVQNDTLPTSG